MENLISMPLLPELETEEGKIMTEMVQLLNYICVAPTLNRQELATKLLGVAAKCGNTLNNQKLKIQSLEKLHTKENEQLEDADESVQHHRENWENSGDANESKHYHEENWQSWDDANESEQHEEENWENWPGANESVQRYEGNWEDSESPDCYQPKECHVDVERLLRDLKDSTTGQTIASSTSEYTVEALLGQGGFGVVAQCFKKPSNETVALKMIKDSISIKEAKEEVKMLDSLKALGAEQFNIVSCKDSFIFDGHFCIEFQKLDVSLLDYVKAQGSLELKDIRPVLQQLTAGLSFLKNARVIHMDLKPHNIMLADRIQQPLKVQIIDFGLARSSVEKRVGEAFGTLMYSSPEVVLRIPSDHATDVWSVGCIAGEMLMGTKLFDIRSEAELMHRIVSILGQPPNDMLNRGLNTSYYFYESSSQPTQDWVLRPSGETSPETSDVPQKKLHDLLKVPVPVPAEDEQAVECDRLAFVDLVERMLCTDASERITPEEILSHPFLTLSHLNDEKHSSYVKSSIDRMRVCDNWSYEGREHAEQSISSNTSNTTDWEVNVSPGQNEETTHCTTPDCCSPSTEKIDLTRNTRRPGLMDRLKRLKTAITKRLRKLMS